MFKGSSIAFVCIIGLLSAQTITVTSPSDNGVTMGMPEGISGELRYAINQINQGMSYDTIDFNLTGGTEITLNQMLPLLNLTNTTLTLIDGTNGGNFITINGNSAYPGFFANQGSITIQNLTLTDTLSLGGDGGMPGGTGGPGYGGALFINNADVTLQGVTFLDNLSNGGAGQVASTSGGGGGGGGLFGANGGDATSSADSGGGGGGIGGIGGDSITGASGGGGGIGLTGTTWDGQGGVGGSDAIDMGAGYGDMGVGGEGGGGNTGTGQDGGGGGGTSTTSETGGGGGGGYNGTFASGNNGGQGGFGGGGGGGAGSGSGGTGGVGGGGGGSGASSFTAGTGYFTPFGGDGGVPGTDGEGGSAEGAAIFLNGGSLTIGGNVQMSGSVSTTGYSPSFVPPTTTSSSGIAAFYNVTPTITFSPGANEIITLMDPIFNPGPIVQNGLGTVNFGNPSVTDFYQFGSNPFLLFSEDVISITDGVLNLVSGFATDSYGDVTPTSGLYATELDIGYTGTLGGSGEVTAPSMVIQGALSPGTFLVLGNGDGGVNTTPSAVNFVLQTAPSPSLLINSGADFSSGTLNINVPSSLNVSSTVPTIFGLIYCEGPITPFANIVQTGSGATGRVIYNPNDPNNPNVPPNSVLYVLNLPSGGYIGPANAFVGTLSDANALIYADACGDIVVLDFTLPGEQLAAVTDFFANQSSLTIQALGGVTTSINGQISSRMSSIRTTLTTTTPIAAWRQTNQLLASATDQPLSAFPPSSFPKQPKFSIYINPLGQFQYQSSITLPSTFLPAFSTHSGGAIFGLDYIGMDTILVGAAGTFVFSKITQEEHLGSQRVGSALASFYSSFIFDQLTFDLLVTGGYSRNNTVRNYPSVAGKIVTVSIGGIPVQIQSTGVPGGKAYATYDSYQLTPHFDLNYEISFSALSLLPFIQSDTIITFENRFKETGAVPLKFPDCSESLQFNQEIDTLITYMLQNETGLNLFEQLDLKDWGSFVFRQKGSYINRFTMPYTLRSKFVGTAEYTKTSIHLPVQHMLGVSGEVTYRNGRFSCIATYEGMFGCGLTSNACFLRLSQDF